MLFLNQYEVEDATLRYSDHPVLGPATQTLRNLMDWTNANSDGWAYWPKPCSAAKKLQELIHEATRKDYGATAGEMAELTEAYKETLRPIKAFRTRQNADFEIVEAN